MRQSNAGEEAVYVKGVFLKRSLPLPISIHGAR